MAWHGKEITSVSHATPGSGGPFKALSSPYNHTQVLAEGPEGGCSCDFQPNPLPLGKAGVREEDKVALTLCCLQFLSCLLKQQLQGPLCIADYSCRSLLWGLFH